MARFLEKELDSRIQRYLKIRKVLRIVELVGVIIVILISFLRKLSVSEVIFSLLAVPLLFECFIAIERWGVKSLIEAVENYLKEELEDENEQENLDYEFKRIILRKELKELEDLKRLVIF